MTAMLPSEFADLEAFSEWCLPAEGDRYTKRLASSMTDLQAFYDAITARAEEALSYCDKFPIDDLPIFPDRALLKSLSQIINGLIDSGTAAGVALLLSRLGSCALTPQDKAWEAALRDFSEWPLHLSTRDGVMNIGADGLADAV